MDLNVSNKCTKCKGDIDIIMSLHNKQYYKRCSKCRDKKKCKHKNTKRDCKICKTI